MRFPSVRMISLLIILLLLASPGALSSDDDPETAPVCNLTEDDLAALSEEMHAEVEALRGMKFKHPVDVGFFTEEEVRAFLQGEEEGEAERWGIKARSDCSMRMIGVVAEECDVEKTFERAMMAFVPGGIYDHWKKILRVVKQEGMNRDSLGIRMTLAHELTHALDDQLFDLAALQKTGGGTSDMAHVWGAVVEGSAVVLQERYGIKAKQSQRFDMNRENRLQKEEMKQMKELFEAPASVSLFMARFPCGVRFLHRGDAKALFKLFSGTGDPGCVADALRTAALDLPRSSEQILHPEKYWQADLRDEPVLVDGGDVEKLAASLGLHVVHTDTVGELLAALLTSPADRKVNPMAMAQPGYWTNEAAKGWGGDRFFLLARHPVAENADKPPEGLCGLWITLWDTPDDCREFVDAYKKQRSLPARRIVGLGSRGAACFYSFDEKSLAALEEDLNTDPPRFTRQGKRWPLSQ